ATAYSGAAQRPRRCSVSSGSSASDGMDVAHEMLRAVVQSVGNARSRSVCHTREQASSPILFPSSGSEGAGNGCVIAELERAGSLPVPALHVVDSGGEEDRRDNQRPVSVGCPSVASAAVGRAADGSVSGFSQASSASRRSSVPAGGELPAPVPAHVEATRLATLYQRFRQDRKSVV